MHMETVLKPNDIETVASARVGDIPGYARVSTHDENPAAQRDRLIEAGAIRVFTDIVSGKSFDRSGLAELIDYARPGDRPCIIRLDTSSAAGGLLFHVFSSIAHFERRLISERTRRRHRRGQETRANIGSTTARPGDGFRRSETHPGRIVTRSSRKTARHWQGNGLQNRRGATLNSKPRPFGALE